MLVERIAARRVELDVLEEELVKRLADVPVERDELLVAERVVQRISEQEYLSLAPAPPEAQVGGRSVLLIPARAAGVGADALPPDYQRILTIVGDAGGPVTVRAVGEHLGLPVEVRGKLTRSAATSGPSPGSSPTGKTPPSYATGPSP